MRILTLAIAGGVLVAFLAVYYQQRGISPDDTYTYLAAGERLNAGHSLYALSPGDRPVVLNPPYWTIPLVSPPAIAVLWRPLAALPASLAVALWWISQVAALGASLFMLGRRMPVATALLMVLLVVPMVDAIGMGNINSSLLLGLIVVWRRSNRDLDGGAGVVAALMTSVKLTPAISIWWLIVTQRRRAVTAAVVTGATVIAVSLIGAGIAAHVDYIGALLNPSSLKASPGSVGGLARSLGVPGNVADLLPTACALLGVGAVLALRRRPEWAYRAMVITMIFGSPAVSRNWYVLLFALLAPTAWPMPTTARGVEPLSTSAARKGRRLARFIG